MRILGVDTATRRASVGLLVDGEVAAEQSEIASGSHAVSLLSLIDTVLRAGGCAVDQLDAVAISNGPGSFTGLRIGLSVAKGLACATGLRLVAVPTLEALARTVADRHGVICALLDARKGELYAACFESGTDGLRRLTADRLLTPAALLQILPTPCVVLGDAVARYADVLHEQLGSRATLLPFESYGPRGAVLARMGWERLQTGAADALQELEPFYVRPSDAERMLP